MRSLAALAAAAIVVGACGEDGITPPNGNVDGTEVELELVSDAFASPVHLTAPSGDGRLFVVDQPGTIRIISDGTLLPDPFLDIRDRVQDGGERGLLSMAFHPDYASNGQFYVNYTDTNGNTRVERYLVSADPNIADVTSAQLVLGVEQPFANHNGGQLAFAPDGMLWIGMGDGGGGGDPDGRAQDLSDLLGKLLRIDVDGGTPYAIPADNPFVGDVDARGEIWAYGVRNPWRFSFDAENGDVYVADVGQQEYEEVNRVSITVGGVNYGWNTMEGKHCFLDPDCSASGLELPVLEYDHDDGCSITGGHVYRGSALPEIAGHYFYGDYCGGWVRSFRIDGGIATDEEEWDFGDIGSVLSFGVDAAGEMYVLTRDDSGGRVWRFVPAT